MEGGVYKFFSFCSDTHYCISAWLGNKMGKEVRFLNAHLMRAEISFVGSLPELVWPEQNAEAWGLEMGLLPAVQPGPLVSRS